ncbi:Cof-type HAD-IIB family hydrolase [Lacticaseibacillus songhuajiangensis]|jgi:Cof subfamily protein (haloacid dehalogenase superfamily)|uniref:Cof-type HAD-IIB family hydrolase n=1 Tax=Lacticaseibacillus songhuajiangensis TaxID=1296539 RepID=UPI0013DDAC79|nr:Cof-type HAD-IIB family hydrolase [Lacticaseibacillus songhuajiangensis]
MYQLAGLDLDGTLYDRHLRISEYNRAALREWVAAGRIVAITSGRMLPRVSALLREDLQVPGYRMCLNGAVVYDTHDKLIAAHPLGKTTVMRAFLLAKRCGVRIRFYSEDYHALYSPELPANYLGGSLDRDVIFRTQAQLRQILERPDVTFYKFTLEAALLNVPALFLARRALMQLPLDMTRSKHLLYEGTAPGVNKLLGMQAIAEHSGIDLEDCICFGDQLNDAQMLAGVGCGVAMANAVPAVKRIASVVGPSNEANGVGKILRQELRRGAVSPN